MIRYVTSATLLLCIGAACTDANTDDVSPDASGAGGNAAGTGGFFAGTGGRVDGGVWDGAGDAATDAGDKNDGAAGCESQCTTTQVCQNGTCVELPPACPCPLESYCDLSTGTCVKGCYQHSQCDSARYCDVDLRVCKPGCRDASECAKPEHGSVTCSAGTCTASCDPGFHMCGEICKSDTAIDACGASCMACPAIANAVALCQAGQCGFSCATGFEDCNGKAGDGCEAPLVKCYRDQDGDGYVVSATPKLACSCGVGWTTKLSSELDCDDSDNRVFPGQTDFFTTASASGGFDFNCDGKAELKLAVTSQACYKFGSTCKWTEGWAYYAGYAWYVPPCGKKGSVVPCVYETGPWAGCDGAYSGGKTRIQACR